MGVQQGKVVPLPGLYRRLYSQGVECMEHKQFQEAEAFFIAATEVEEYKEGAHFGIVLSRIELGKAAEAKSCCEKMLDEGIGEYYDILDPYITVLIQLEEYQIITSFVEDTLQRSDLPPTLKERLLQVLDYCRVRPAEANTENEDRFMKQILDAHTADHQQDGGVQTGHILPEIDGDMDQGKHYLRNKDVDPYFKTMFLQYLKDQQYEDTVSVYKYGKTFDVDPQNMGDITADPLFNDVKQWLAEILEQQNPSFYQMAIQLWKHFMLSVFPIPLQPCVAPLWAGAVHELVHTMNGAVADRGVIAQYYDVTENALTQAVDWLQAVEEETKY